MEPTSGQREEKQAQWDAAMSRINLAPIRDALDFFDERAGWLARDVMPQAAAVAAVGSLHDINKQSYIALKAAVVEAIALGAPVVTVAEYAGISRVTAAAWRDEASSTSTRTKTEETAE